jgi:phage terminase large subunit
MPEMQMPKALLPFAQKKKRFKVAFGGRGSGKSMTFGDICLMDAQTKAIKTACFREYQNSIDDSVLSLLTSEISRLNLQGFECQQSKILYRGEECFKFRGLARNPEGVKSMHGFQRFWVEEAQTISFESLKNLIPTLRIEGSELWFSANLRSMADPFTQRFFKPFEKELRANGYYEDDDHLIVWINYNDNPLFPEVLDRDRQYDEANLSPALYRHIWLGETYDSVDDCIIPVEWFEAAIDAHVKLGFKPEGAIIATHDPSDTGPDPKGFAVRHGSVFTDIREESVGDVNEGLDWALNRARQAGADHFVWDCDGMGAPLKRDVDKSLSGTKMRYFMFKGSEASENPDSPFIDVGDRSGGNNKKNKDSLANKRAQYAHRLMMRFYNTWRAVEKGDYLNPDELISICSSIDNLDEIRAQVCRVPRKRNNNGKFQVMTKLEMSRKPYELPSPNMFDSMMMSMYIPQTIAETTDIDFDGWG